jgi:hypothetical protein
MALAVRVWWVATVDTQPVTDFAWYFDRAVSLAAGEGYHVDGAPTAYWPVGYPAFLALFFSVFGPSLELAKALNLGLTVASVLLSWMVARRLFPNPWVAHLTGMTLAIYPSWVAYSSILASEPLFTSLTLGGTALLLAYRPRQWPWLAMAGVVFGLATLVRPQAVVLPAVLLLCLAWFDRREEYRGSVWRAALWIYGALAVTLVPWTARNLETFGQFVFVSTNGGDNLLIGHHPASFGKYAPPTKLAPEIEGMEETERDKASRQLALEAIRADPARSFRLIGPKLKATFMSGTDAPYWAFQTKPQELIVPGMDSQRPLFLWFSSVSRAAPSIVLFVFVSGLLLGLAARSKDPSSLPATPLGVLFVTAGLVSLFFGNPRFAFPVVPFLLMVGIGPWVALAHRLTAGSRSS